MPNPQMWMRWRDLALFVAGLLGVVHETLIRVGPERPYLLMTFAAMMGMPLFFNGRKPKDEV